MKRIPTFALAVLLAGTGCAFAASSQDGGGATQSTASSSMHKLGADLRGALHRIGSATKHALHRADSAIHKDRNNT